MENKELDKKYKGISPIKLKFAIDLTKTGLLSKSGDEIINAFNYIFDKNDVVHCRPCSISRYRNAIYSFVEYGQKVYKKYGIDLEFELSQLEEPKEEEVKEETEDKNDEEVKEEEPKVKGKRGRKSNKGE